MAGIKLSRRALAAGRAGDPPESFSGGGASGDLPMTPVPPDSGLELSPEPLRALRMKWLTDAQSSASKDFTKALGGVVDIGRRDPTNPMLPTLRGDVARELPNLLPPVTVGQAAALSRERARAGQDTTALDATTDRIRAGVERGEKVLDPNAGLAGKLDRFNAGAASAFHYPLKLVSALLRPFDSGVPAAVKAKIEGRAPGTAAAAAADPLGRFNEGGTETGRWTNPPTTWHDVGASMLKRWGKPVEKPWGVETAPGETYTHPLTGKEVRTPGPIRREVDTEFLGMGRPGWAAAGTVADIALSPSTYLTAAAGSGKGIQIAGQTVVPDAAVTGIARFPGSVLERGAEALASHMALSPRFSLQAAHRVGAAGEVLGKIGPAQLLSGAPKVVGALPLGGGKTLGELTGEAFDRYYRIKRVEDPALRDQLLRLARFRESATQAQTANWTSQVENLFRGVPPQEQQAIRDMIENPAGFDWNVERRGPVPAPEPRAVVPAGVTTIRSPSRPYMGYSDEELGRILDDVRAKIESEGAAEQGVSVEEFRRRVREWAEEQKRKGIDPTTGRPPEPANEVPVQGRSTTSGAAVAFGQPAAPTAVPGTPDAARYGAIPNHLSGQVPTVTEGQREIVARVENLLRDVREALKERGLVRGRENYFPRERTRESLIVQKGEGARLEKLGRGASPRLDWRAGFQEGRMEHSWINDLIDKTNEQLARDAEAKGMSPNLIPRVEDSTTAINEFWRRLPEPVRQQLRGKGTEPERFIDRPKEVLERYLSRATKSVNDFDALQAVRGMKGERGPVARPFIREGADGRVFENYEVPVGGSYARPTSGPGVMVDPTPAPRGAPQLSRGAMGRKREAMVGPEPRPIAGELPGEVPPGGREAFQGKSPLDPAMSTRERPLHDYVYPKNQAWRESFPNVALPKDIASWIDAFGKPYWANEGLAGIIDQGIVRPLHKIQLPWKVAATSGAGVRFALRNYMSQQVMNLQAYGPTVLMPRIQRESHLLGLPDEIFAARPHLGERVITDATGRQWKASELRQVAQQTGLWRTMPEAETWSAIGGPYNDVWSGPGHATRVAGWNDSKATASAVLGAAERGVQTATHAIAPANPISKDFVATKGLPIGPGGARVGFHPLAEYGERQGRMAALLSELDQGKELVQAAQDANRVHVDYTGFSPAFEKYGTLAWPFAKFAVGITPNEAKWALQYPGRTMFTEHLLRGGEAMVPEDQRKRYAQEPKSSLTLQGGARLLGFGKDGPLKEPETAHAKGPMRLPYVTMPPTADVFLNTLGAPARVLGARDRGSAAATETLEGAFPAFKAPFEIATGRNVATGEPIDANQATIAPRAVQALYEKSPALARLAFSATPVLDRKTGQSYLAVPQKVALVWRYFPNVAAVDLAAGLLGVKRPYDNQTAIALRLLGVTQVMHDPLVPATQEAFGNRDEAPRIRRRVEIYTPPRR